MRLNESNEFINELNESNEFINELNEWLMKFIKMTFCPKKYFITSKEVSWSMKMFEWDDR